MKNTLYIILALVGMIAFLPACNDEDGVQFNPGSAVAPVLSNLSASSYTLSKNQASGTFNTFTYTQSNYDNVQFAVQYILQAALTNTFDKPLELGTSTGLSQAVTNATINSYLINKGIEVGKSTPLYFRVVSQVKSSSGTVSAISDLVSNVVTANVAPYDVEIEYPKVYTRGLYNNWDPTGQCLFSFNSDKTYQAVIDLGTATDTPWGWKITGGTTWDNSTGNWGLGTGTAKNGITLANNGGNITGVGFDKRFYRVTFVWSSLDAPTLTQDVGFNKLTIVGDAGSEVSGWGGKEVELIFDKAKQRFTAEVTFAAGVIKFRADNAWDLNWGGSDGILKPGGDNISVKAGKYRVIVNLNNPNKMTYQLIEL